MTKKVTKEAAANKSNNSGYFIDFERLERWNRSPTVIIQSRLCPGCQSKLESRTKGTNLNTLLANIRSCCSKNPDFITTKMTLSEKVFKILLVSNNEPVPVNQLMKELEERSSGSISISEEALKRLLDNDQFYGFNHT